VQRALLWFRRAAKLGHDGSYLEIAKHFLNNENDPGKAMHFLNRVCKSNRVSEAEIEEAKLLDTCKKRTAISRKGSTLQ
jgi:hypothetical protein